MRDGRSRVAVFARAPEPGSVKTRLAETLGEAAALEAYLELVEGTLQALKEGAFDCELWFDGARNGHVQRWQSDYGLPAFRQPEADLGARMLAALEAGVKVVVGTDIPVLDAAYVEDGLSRLAQADAVLGPVEDGGYCLVGMNVPQPELFRSIAWSTDTVVQQTLHRAAAAGLDIALLDTLWDVDDHADYVRWRAWLQVDSEMGTGCATLARERSSASERTGAGGDHA